MAQNFYGQGVFPHCKAQQFGPIGLGRMVSNDGVIAKFEVYPRFNCATCGGAIVYCELSAKDLEGLTVTA